MRKTILVVDDDSIMLQSYEKILSETGHTVITRRDGHEALIAIHEGLRVDLMITDYRMPGMNGLELVALVKRHSSQLPVIMCSAYVRPDIYLKALDLGVVEYLEKPFRLNEFKRIVAMVFEVPSQQAD